MHESASVRFRRRRESHGNKYGSRSSDTVRIAALKTRPDRRGVARQTGYRSIGKRRYEYLHPAVAICHAMHAVQGERHGTEAWGSKVGRRTWRRRGFHGAMVGEKINAFSWRAQRHNRRANIMTICRNKTKKNTNDTAF